MADLENDEDENQSERKTIVDPDSGPDKSALNSEIAEYLRRALLMIPEEQRVVIIMKEYHGLKFIEIEAILQIPLNTIKSRLYYGLSAMQKIFRQWGLDREDLRYEM
jgi:RNA polymerase sigma-70 factor (ECF subfamily)